MASKRTQLPFIAALSCQSGSSSVVLRSNLTLLQSEPGKLKPPSTAGQTDKQPLTLFNYFSKIHLEPTMCYMLPILPTVFRHARAVGAEAPFKSGFLINFAIWMGIFDAPPLPPHDMNLANLCQPTIPFNGRHRLLVSLAIRINVEFISFITFNVFPYLLHYIKHSSPVVVLLVGVRPKWITLHCITTWFLFVIVLRPAPKTNPQNSFIVSKIYNYGSSVDYSKGSGDRFVLLNTKMSFPLFVFVLPSTYLYRRRYDRLH